MPTPLRVVFGATAVIIAATINTANSQTFVKIIGENNGGTILGPTVAPGTTQITTHVKDANGNIISRSSSFSGPNTIADGTSKPGIINNFYVPKNSEDNIPPGTFITNNGVVIGNTVLPPTGGINVVAHGQGGIIDNSNKIFGSGTTVNSAGIGFSVTVDGVKQSSSGKSHSTPTVSSVSINNKAVPSSNVDGVVNEPVTTPSKSSSSSSGPGNQQPSAPPVTELQSRSTLDEAVPGLAGRCHNSAGFVLDDVTRKCVQLYNSVNQDGTCAHPTLYSRVRDGKFTKLFTQFQGGVCVRSEYVNVECAAGYDEYPYRYAHPIPPNSLRRCISLWHCDDTPSSVPLSERPFKAFIGVQGILTCKSAEKSEVVKQNKERAEALKMLKVEIAELLNGVGVPLALVVQEKPGTTSSSESSEFELLPKSSSSVLAKGITNGLEIDVGTEDSGTSSLDSASVTPGTTSPELLTSGNIPVLSEIPKLKPIHGNHVELTPVNEIDAASVMLNVGGAWIHCVYMKVCDTKGKGKYIDEYTHMPDKTGSPFCCTELAAGN